MVAKMKLFVLLSVLTQLVDSKNNVSGQTLIKDVDQECFFNITLNTTATTIQSPSFKGGQENRTKCVWVIKTSSLNAVILLQFDVFDLLDEPRCQHDHVMIYGPESNSDGVFWQQKGLEEGYCGKLQPFTHLENNNRLLIKYKWSGSQLSRGFNASVSMKFTGHAPTIHCLNQYTKHHEKNESCDPTNNTRIIMEEFNTVTLECDARGADPMATISWRQVQHNDFVLQSHGYTNATFRNITLLPLHAGIIKNTFKNGSVQLHRLRVNDSGDYRCIASNKHGNAIWNFTLDIEEKCLCPKNIATSWYSYPPYTRYYTGTVRRNGIKSNKYKGILYDILPDLMQHVCGSCGKKNTSQRDGCMIHWNDESNLRKSLLTVNQDIFDDTADLYFPIENSKYLEKYKGSYYFIPLIESPGTVFFLTKETSKSQSILYDAVINSWPLYVMIFLLSICAGIIYWMLDTYWNEKELPHSFGHGCFQGVWWAFVTMTSVGYGDVTPKGAPGRLFAIIWTLCGCVIVALFTSIFTTVLNVSVMTTKPKLYGNKIGAIHNSLEYKLGVVQNAKMTGYRTLKELREGLLSDGVKGALVDTYVAAHFQVFNEFRINKLLSTSKRYGIVLGSKLSKHVIYEKMLDYVEDNRAKIFADISRNTKRLPKTTMSDAVEKSKKVINSKSSYFRNAATKCSLLLLAAVVGGLLLECIYLRPRARMLAKKIEFLESMNTVKDVRQILLLKKNLLSDLAELKRRFIIKMTSLKTKHEAQIKLLKKQNPQQKKKRRDDKEDCIEMYVTAL